MSPYPQRFIGTGIVKSLCLILSPLLGFLAFLLPELIKEGFNVNEQGNTILSVVEYTVKNLVILPTLVLLILIGVVLGLFGRDYWLPCGLLTVALYPLVALYEIAISTSSQTLLPFEFMIYFFLSIPGIMGAFIGWKISCRLKNSNKNSERAEQRSKSGLR